MEKAKYYSQNSGVATAYFYCDAAQPTTLNGSALLASFTKQLLVYLARICKPRPPKVQEDINKFFGAKRSEPDFFDLTGIFSSLYTYSPGAIYIIDGLDEFNEEEVGKVLHVVRQLFGGESKQHDSRIIVFSRDQVAPYLDVTRAVPGTTRVSLSVSNVMNDIQKYIDTVIEEKTAYVRELTSDPALMAEIKQKLLEGASGMYVLQRSDLYILC